MNKTNINVGDIYEDCGYHPVRCTKNDGEDVSGVSMVDGTHPRNCSLKYCGVKKLTEAEAKELLTLWNNEGEKGVLLKWAKWPEENVNQYLKDYVEKN